MIHSLDRNWSMIETFGSTRKKKGVALYGDLLDLEGHVGLKPMSCRRVGSVNTFSASSAAALAWARDSASSSAESLLMKGGVRIEAALQTLLDPLVYTQALHTVSRLDVPPKQLTTETPQ